MVVVVIIRGDTDIPSICAISAPISRVSLIGSRGYSSRSGLIRCHTSLSLALPLISSIH